MTSLKFRTWFISCLSLITLALSLIFVYIFTDRFIEYSMSALEEYGESITANLSFISADFLIMEDYAPLQEFVENFSTRSSIEDLCIADRYGFITASTELTALGNSFAGWQDVAEKDREQLISINKEAQQIIIVTSIKIEAQVIGYIRLALSMQKMNSKVAAGKRQGLLVGMIAWIISVVFAMVIAARLSRPLQRLTEHTDRIKNGDFSSNDRPGEGIIELDEFSRALNVMAKTIGTREESLRQMVSNLDNLPTPVFSIDSTFHITYINPAGATVAGLTPGEAIGEKCAVLFNTPICNTHGCPMRLAMNSQQVITGETTIGQDHLTTPVNYTTVAFRDRAGAITGGLESFIDISKLKQVFAETDTQNKLRSAQMAVSDRLRGELDEATICNNLLSELVLHIPVQLGMVYLADEAQSLHLCASYASLKSIDPPPSFHFGEGITGQAALEKRPIQLHQVPEDYVHIFSASGEALPRHILALPFLLEGKVKGVIELGSFVAPDSFALELLNRIIDTLAIAINMAQSRRSRNTLLNQTQQQAEELQSQQEELHAGNEELREQTEALKTSERQLQQQAEELQSQQEELQVTNEELSERTRSLEEQQKHINDKNEELSRHRNDLLKKTNELETTNRYKSEFLANMSHELRTPLNSILILSQLFASNKEENLSKKQIKYARTINTSGTELLTLINEVLDLSKVEAGRMELSIAPLNLLQFLTDMKESFAPVAAEQGIALVTELSDDAPASINTDHQKLLQIVKNLLSNSIKFTEQGSVSLRISRPVADMDLGRLAKQTCVSIAVKDTGIGIAENKQKVIFQAFQQVDGTISRKYGGTGLGLSIADELTGLLGGEIRLTSKLGQGATFTILLPETLTPSQYESEKRAGNDHDENPAPPQISSPSLKRRTIREDSQGNPVEEQQVKDDRKKIGPHDKSLLIIEDDTAFAQVLVDLAHERNFKCIIAEDGESGLHYADYFQPGAIILDIGLPGIDGWQVMDKLKMNAKTSHIPVHFMSAADKSLQAREKGAIGFLTKPISIDKVQEALGLLEDKISRTVKKLLIVEDHQVQRSSMVELISDPHIEICAVATGNEAWQRLSETAFDCIILDLGLPDMEGYKLLEMIQTDATVQQVPVIIYTGRELSREENKLLRRYSNAIIIKGVQSPERLLAETTLFLHQVESELPEDKQRMLAMVHNREDIFASRKILVVDDDMRNVFALSSILEEKGMEVLTAENGRMAMETLKDMPDIDLVLMDIMMPEMDGFEAMRRIRSQSRFKKLPIIALTAKAMKGDRHKCIEAGANDYLAKPVDVDRLLSLLRVWLCR